MYVSSQVRRPGGSTCQSSACKTAFSIFSESIFELPTVEASKSAVLAHAFLARSRSTAAQSAGSFFFEGPPWKCAQNASNSTTESNQCNCGQPCLIERRHMSWTQVDRTCGHKECPSGKRRKDPSSSISILCRNPLQTHFESSSSSMCSSKETCSRKDVILEQQSHL